MTDPIRYAAVAYIERDDGRILTVGNRRYGGMTLPGGLVEPGETLEAAVARELQEETGLLSLSSVLPYRPRLIFRGPHGGPEKPGRASHVALFAVQPIGEPRAMEEGCPVAWKTRAEFLEATPFRAFYERVFAVIPEGRYEETADWPDPFDAMCEDMLAVLRRAEAAENDWQIEKARVAKIEAACNRIQAICVERFARALGEKP